MYLPRFEPTTILIMKIKLARILLLFQVTLVYAYAVRRAKKMSVSNESVNLLHLG